MLLKLNKLPLFFNKNIYIENYNDLFISFNSKRK